MYATLVTLEGWLTWLARPLRLGLGYVWSASLLLFGLWLWEQRTEVVLPLMGWAGTGDLRTWEQIVRGFAVFATAGAQFVFMFLVADDLFPNTPLMISEFLEFFSATLALGSLAWTAWVFTHNVIP